MPSRPSWPVLALVVAFFVSTGERASLAQEPVSSPDAASDSGPEASDAGADFPAIETAAAEPGAPATGPAVVAPPLPPPKPRVCPAKDGVSQRATFVFEPGGLDKMGAAEDDGDPKRSALASVDAAGITRRAFRSFIELELPRLALTFGKNPADKLLEQKQINRADAEKLGVDPGGCYDYVLVASFQRKEAAWDEDELDIDVEITAVVFRRQPDGGFEEVGRRTRHNVYSSHFGKSPARQQLRDAECPNAVADEAKSAADQGAHASCRLFEAAAAATIELANELTDEVPDFRIAARLIALPGGGVGVPLGRRQGIRYGQAFIAMRRNEDGSEERLGFAKVISLGEGDEQSPSRLRFRMGDAEPGDIVERYPMEGFRPGFGPMARYQDRGPLGKKMAYGGHFTLGVEASLGWPSENWVNVGFAYLRDDHINYFPLTIGVMELLFHTLPRLDFSVTPLSLQGELGWVKWSDLYSGQIQREWTVGVGSEAALQFWITPSFGLRAAAGYYHNFREIKLDAESLGGEYGDELSTISGVPDITSSGGVGIGNLSGPVGTFSLVFLD